MEKIYIDDQNEGRTEVTAQSEIITALRHYFAGKILNLSDKVNFSSEIIQNKGPGRLKFDKNFKPIDLYRKHSVVISDDFISGESGRLIIDHNIKLVIEGNHLEISYREKNDFLLIFICHVVRATLDKLLLSNGYSLLHAGGFVLGDKTVLVIGDKGCGKTTAVVTALDEFNASYLSNDRIFAKERNGRLHVIDREADIKIARQTIEGSSLMIYLHDAPLDHEQEKYYFNYLYEYIGNGRVTQSYATHIILPEINRAIEDCYPIQYQPEILTSSIIRDCVGFKLYKLLFNSAQDSDHNFDKLNLVSIEAKGKMGIRKSISLLK